MTSKLKNDSVPTSLNRSLRNRPSRLLYQPPAQRCADKQLKSSSSSEAQTIKSETFSKTISLSKLNEHKRKPLCGFKQAKEQSPLAYSRITPSSPRCQENLRGASNAKLKSTENPYLSERKPGLGRGNLLKLQLRYEHEFVKANRIHNPIENQTNSDKEDAVHVPNLVKTDSQLSTDFNHNNSNNNHLGKPFLELPGSDSPASKFHNVATPQKINNSKPLMCEDIVSSQNPKWQENIVPPSTKLHDGMQYVSEEAVWEKGKGDDLQNIAESFGPGDWDPKEEACSTPGLDISLLSLQKTPKAKNDDNSVLDHNFGLTLGDLKEATEIFYSSNETEEEVFDSQGSVLSDETYLTVSSHLSDVEENTESMSRSTDGCDYNSLLSESNSLVECISGDSSTDVFSTPAKTSFNDSQDVNKRSSESSLSFQNNSKVDVTNFTDSTDRINCHANYKSGDNQLQWNTVQVKNQISLKEHSILPPKPKSSPKSDRCQMSDLTATSSTKYPSPCSSNSGQKNFSFCSSPTYYQNPTSLSPQTPMVSHSVFENSSSCRASHLQSCNKENISKELAKHVSYQQVGHRPRHFCSGTKSEGFIIDALRSRVKEFYYKNQNHWKRSAFQYKQIFGGIESWKENYKKKCSEAGHKFLDTHCHIDMMLTEHLDRIYGTFQEYRQANADTFPQEFGGCVAIFCNPLTFNPRGKHSTFNFFFIFLLFFKYHFKDLCYQYLDNFVSVLLCIYTYISLMLLRKAQVYLFALSAIGK